MKVIDGKIRLAELAQRLGVTSAAMRLHLTNSSGLGQGAVKIGDRVTGDWFIPVDSVLTYLQWAMSHSKKLDYETLSKVEEEVKELKNG